MDDPRPKLQTLFKAQSVLTRIELRAKAAQAVYMCIALVFGLLALGMLNLAAYLALSDPVGPVWAGVIVAGIDLLLAIVLLKIAKGAEPGPELESAREVRDLAMDALTTDADRVKSQVLAVRDDIKSVTSRIAGITSVVGVIKGALKKRKKERS